MASAFNAPVVPSQSYQGEPYANPGVIGAVVSATFGPWPAWQRRKASDDWLAMHMHACDVQMVDGVVILHVGWHVCG